MEFRNLRFKSPKNLYSDTKEKSYMVSLSNSKEFLAVCVRYGRVFTRILWQRSKVPNRILWLTKFGNHLLRLHADHGSVFVVKYLKACTIALQRFISGQPLSSFREIEPDFPLPRLTSSGLPSFIPSRDRVAIGSLSVRVIRWYLTLFSIYRIISCEGKTKLNTITDPFSGKQEVVDEVCSWLLSNSKSLLSRFSSSFQLSASLGLERISKASPSAKNSWAGFLQDAYSWRDLQGGGFKAELSNFLTYGQWSLFYDLFEIYKSQLLPYTWSFGAIDRSTDENHISSRMKVISKEPEQMPLGQLSPKVEAAGKIRIFAMVDIWTQSALRPLHDWLYRVFKVLPNDSTFNQDVGFIRAMQKATASNCAYCFDLSSATDRLPISIQISILDSLFNEIEQDGSETDLTYGQAWAQLLTNRYYYPSVSLKELLPAGSPDKFKYSVGQPMGALSSWGMLNLSHHLFLQFLNHKVYKTRKWAENYEVLGDDIVIFDKKIADLYLEYMEGGLGVACNISKSLISPDRPVVEFAKRVSIGMKEVSPFSWRQIRSFDTLMGRAAMAASLVTRSHLPSPLRGFDALLGPTFDKSLSSRSYGLINMAASAVNRGLLDLEVLLKLLVDPFNPFRFIGARIINNIRVGWFRDMVVAMSKSEDLPEVTFHSKVLYLDRLFSGFVRGYMVSKLEDTYLALVLALKEMESNVDALCDGVCDSDTFISLFFSGKRFKSKVPRPDFESMALVDQISLLEEYEQWLRDCTFYKAKPEPRLSLENSLKTISFIEKSRKKGEIIVPLDQVSRWRIS